MKKLMKILEKFNLDKQIEKRAQKEGLSVKEYLNKHPEVKKDYKEKKENQLRVKLALAAGTLTVGTMIGVFTLKENEEPVVENTQIEQTQEYYEEVNEVEENENQYAEFFEMIENEDNTERRNEMILNQTKEIIVDAYNNQNPDEPITTDRLQVLILSEAVIQRTDRLGNVTYERAGKGQEIELAENEELVDRGNIYVFSIDGNNVATYLQNGDRLEDKTIENEETYFRNTINMVKEYQNLVDNFRFPTNEPYTNSAERSFEEAANKVLNENNMNKEIQQELAEK